MTSTLDYALMAGNAYQSTRDVVNQIPFPSGDGWAPLAEVELRYRQVGGFEATAYKNGNEVVISFAGTGPGLSVDWVSNSLLGLGLGGIDPQLLAAVHYYEEIKAAYGPNISFTGHSLGGGLAALMGVFFNKTAVTFNPAPFKLSATSLTAWALKQYLSSQGLGQDSDLNGFTSLAGRLDKVTAYAMAGEILNNPVSNALRIFNEPLNIYHHAPFVAHAIGSYVASSVRERLSRRQRLLLSGS